MRVYRRRGANSRPYGGSLTVCEGVSLSAVLYVIPAGFLTVCEGVSCSFASVPAFSQFPHCM